MKKCELVPAMELAGKNLLDCLNRDADMLPNWSLDVDETYHAHFLFHRPVHNIGRWWDAMLRLEESIGFLIPPEQEAAMLKNIMRFYDNPDHFCIEPDGIESVGSCLFDDHSMRESLLALCVLIRRRGSIWAKQTGHLMLETVDRFLCEDCSCDKTVFEYYTRHPEFVSVGDPTHTHGRLIEALILFFELTGDTLAFRLAERLAEWHFAHSTKPDGTIDGLDIHHSHSYMGTLRGLFLYGKLTGQRKYIDRVKLSYDVTVCSMFYKSGFLPHDIGADVKGETTCPGDAAQLALWFALDGDPKYLDDAERYVRTRILPTQITESPKLIPDGEGADIYADLDDRILGGFGGVYKRTHGGKYSITDVTAADVHSLTDIYNHIVVETEALTRIFFHFCCKTSSVTVDSFRDGKRAVLNVESKTGKLLEIRIPGWTSAESVCVKVNGESVTPRIRDGFLRIAADGMPVSVTVTYALPEMEIEETIHGETYRLRFVGDEIVGVSPNTDYYPFYPSL